MEHAAKFDESFTFRRLQACHVCSAHAHAHATQAPQHVQVSSDGVPFVLLPATLFRVNTCVVRVGAGSAYDSSFSSRVLIYKDLVWFPIEP